MIDAPPLLKTSTACAHLGLKFSARCQRNTFCTTIIVSSAWIEKYILWSKMAFVVRAGRILGPVNNYLRPVAKCRFISTSKKNDETAVVNEKMASHQDVDAAAAAAVAAKKV